LALKFDSHEHSFGGDFVNHPRERFKKLSTHNDEPSTHFAFLNGIEAKAKRAKSFLRRSE
jgi:hypothetical protein